MTWVELTVLVYWLVSSLAGWLVGSRLARAVDPAFTGAARLALAVVAPLWLPAVVTYLIAAAVERHGGRGAATGGAVHPQGAGRVGGGEGGGDAAAGDGGTGG